MKQKKLERINTLEQEAGWPLKKQLVIGNSIIIFGLHVMKITNTVVD